MKNLFCDRRGIVPALVVLIVTDILVAMLWIVTMPAVVGIWNVIVPSLPDRALGTMNMLNNAMGWTLLVLVGGTLVYGAAWATHRDPYDVPLG